MHEQLVPTALRRDIMVVTIILLRLEVVWIAKNYVTICQYHIGSHTLIFRSPKSAFVLAYMDDTELKKNYPLVKPWRCCLS